MAPHLTLNFMNSLKFSRDAGASSLLLLVLFGCSGPALSEEPDQSSTSDTDDPHVDDGTTGSSSSGGSRSTDTGSGGAPASTCTNRRPTGTEWDEASCEQWRNETMECDEAWMVDGGFCNESCGRCSAGSSSGGSGPSGGSSGSGDSSGSGGSGSPISPTKKFVGNITTNNQVDAGGLKFATHWDQITPENAGKWGSVQQNTNGGFNWGTLDAIYDYAQQNNIIFKQHAFVWGEQQPQGSPNQEQVINWIKSFCARYPNTKLIDVVNEPPPHTTPSYVDNIGGGTNGNWQWITNSFKWAREHCPNSILILNDYNNIEWPTDNQHFIDIVNTVLENGGPIDAVGAQAHDLDHESMTFETVTRLLNKLHNDTGLPVYITEMDLSYTDDAQQLNAYQQYFPLFMDSQFVSGITIWGWIYGSTWSQAPSSGLVRNGASRSAMNWLMNELGRPTP